MTKKIERDGMVETIYDGNGHDIMADDWRMDDIAYDEIYFPDLDTGVDDIQIEDIGIDDIWVDDLRAEDIRPDDIFLSDSEEWICDSPCETREDCDDGNICTEDFCTPITLCCIHFTESADYSNCGDDLFCNGADYCLDGYCLHEDIRCPDCGECATAECFEDRDDCMCTPLPRGTRCGDEYSCALCMDGICEHYGSCPIDTGNPCTRNACFEIEPHCVEEMLPDGTACPDDNLCNGSEFCRGGECSVVIPACFDGDPCTQDACISETGSCENNIISDCFDCTGDPACNDGNPCTDDYCRNVGGEIECENISDPMCPP